MIVTSPHLKLINNERVTMTEVAQLAQWAGVAVVECGGEFAYCDARQIPAGWHRIGIHAKTRVAA